MVEVRPPRVKAVRRRRPDHLTLDDSATVEEGPELLQLLMRPLGGSSWPLGRGIHPMTTVPLGLAIDAAIEAAGGEALDVGTLRFATFSMEAFTSNRRPLRATARIVLLAAHHVEADVQVWEVTQDQGTSKQPPARPGTRAADRAAVDAYRRPGSLTSDSRTRPRTITPAPAGGPPSTPLALEPGPNLRLILKGRVGLVRVRRGRAAELAPLYGPDDLD